MDPLDDLPDLINENERGGSEDGQMEMEATADEGRASPLPTGEATSEDDEDAKSEALLLEERRGEKNSDEKDTADEQKKAGKEVVQTNGGARSDEIEMADSIDAGANKSDGLPADTIEGVSADGNENTGDVKNEDSEGNTQVRARRSDNDAVDAIEDREDDLEESDVPTPVEGSDNNDDTVAKSDDTEDDGKKDEVQDAINNAIEEEKEEDGQEDDYSSKKVKTDDDDEIPEAQDDVNVDEIDNDDAITDNQTNMRELSEAEKEAVAVMSQLGETNANQPAEDNDQHDEDAIEYLVEEPSDGYVQEEDNEMDGNFHSSDSDDEENEEEDEEDDDVELIRESRRLIAVAEAQSESSSDEYEVSSEDEVSVVTLDDSDDSDTEEQPGSSSQQPIDRNQKRPMTRPQPAVNELVIDEEFKLPPRGDISKKLMVKVPNFNEEICTCRPNYCVPLPGISVDTGNELVIEINFATREDFAHSGKISGMISFTPDESWPENNARACLFYYVWTSNTGEWSRSEFITVAAENGQQTKIPFVLDLGKKVDFTPDEENLAAIRMIKNQKITVVAVVGADGLLVRSVEDSIDFATAIEHEMPKRKRVEPDSDDAPECIEID